MLSRSRHDRSLVPYSTSIKNQLIEMEQKLILIFESSNWLRKSAFGSVDGCVYGVDAVNKAVLITC